MEDVEPRLARLGTAAEMLSSVRVRGPTTCARWGIAGGADRGRSRIPISEIDRLIARKLADAKQPVVVGNAPPEGM